MRMRVWCTLARACVLVCVGVCLHVILFHARIRIRSLKLACVKGWPLVRATRDKIETAFMQGQVSMSFENVQ